MAKAKAPAPKVGGPSQDLISRGMLPDVPTIKPGAGFGDDIKTKKPGGRAAGGHIKKMAGGGQVPAKRGMGSGSMQPPPNPRYGKTPQEPYNEKDLGYSGVSKDPVIPGPFEYPSYIEEVGEERISGPRMRKGGAVKSSASKRADGIAQRGKTRGKFV